MANKIQIKKFLEKKQQEAIDKLNDESKELQEKAKDAFFEAYEDNFNEIKNEVIATASKSEKLSKAVTELGLATFGNRYSCPLSYFNELINKLSISNLRGYYIEVVEATKIENRYKKKIEETDREYKSLIALCQANTTKDGIIILENLGFDTSEIEVKQESTALITNIDASKLFIKK